MAGEREEQAATPPHSSAWAGAYSASAGLPFDDEELETRLLWIWGSPRSGSTWLLRQLCFPALVDEDLPLGFGVPDGAPALGCVPFNEFLVSNHAAPRGPNPVEVDGTVYAQTPNVFLAGFNSYAFCEEARPDWTPELRRLILVRIAATIDRARSAGAPIPESPVVAIKEVNGSHAADLVMSLFPRSRMLLLLRDARDVIDSRLHAHGPRGWLVGRDGPRFKTDAERLEWVRRACLDWACNIDASESAYARHDEQRRRRLRYEDLLADPEREMTGLLAWLGLDATPERVRTLVRANAFERVAPEQRGARKTFRSATPGLWRKNLSRAERGAIAELIGERLRRLGYD